jgi:hypothetical protein
VAKEEKTGAKKTVDSLKAVLARIFRNNQTNKHDKSIKDSDFKQVYPNLAIYSL